MVKSIKPPSESIGSKLSERRLAEVFRQIDFSPCEKYGPHSHHRLEINYVKRGTCLLRLNDRTVTFRKDDLMVIPSGLAHTFEAEIRGTRLIQLEFMPELFSDIMRDSGNSMEFMGASRKLLVIRSNVRIRSLLQMIIWELRHQESGFKQIVMSGYMQLLILLMREIRSDNAYAAYPPVLARILDMIDSANHCNITIAEITAEKNISTRYLRKLFATHIGISPAHYIVGKRIEHVKNLLVNTDMALKEIGFQCGFSSERHLHACSVRVMGYPPSRHLG